MSSCHHVLAKAVVCTWRSDSSSLKLAERILCVSPRLPLCLSTTLRAKIGTRGTAVRNALCFGKNRGASMRCNKRIWAQRFSWTVVVVLNSQLNEHVLMVDLKPCCQGARRSSTC